MMTMPAKAAAIASQVRGDQSSTPPKGKDGGEQRRQRIDDQYWRRVSVSAIMKQVNITAQHRPKSGQIAAAGAHVGRAGTRRAAYTNHTISVMAQNRLRQKVTSKLFAPSRWRVKTPAMLHMKAASTMGEDCAAMLLWRTAGHG